MIRPEAAWCWWKLSSGCGDEKKKSALGHDHEQQTLLERIRRRRLALATAQHRRTFRYARQRRPRAPPPHSNSDHGHTTPRVPHGPAYRRHMGSASLIFLPWVQLGRHSLAHCDSAALRWQLARSTFRFDQQLKQGIDSTFMHYDMRTPFFVAALICIFLDHGPGLVPAPRPTRALAQGTRASDPHAAAPPPMRGIARAPLGCAATTSRWLLFARHQGA